MTLAIIIYTEAKFNKRNLIEQVQSRWKQNNEKQSNRIEPVLLRSVVIAIQVLYLYLYRK